MTDSVPQDLARQSAFYAENDRTREAGPDEEEPAAPTLQYSIETLVEVNLGDHGERRRLSHVAVPGETVEELVRRVFPDLSSPYRTHCAGDEIVLRVLVDVDGKPTGQVPYSTTAPW